jgi:hypothetical protein
MPSNVGGAREMACARKPDPSWCMAATESRIGGPNRRQPHDRQQKPEPTADRVQRSGPGLFHAGAAVVTRAQSGGSARDADGTGAPP